MRKPEKISEGPVAGVCSGGAARRIRGVILRLATALVLTALSFAALGAPAAAAQTMTIRLVEAKSGKPIHNKTVSVAFYVEDSSMTNARRRVALPDGKFWTNLALDKDGRGGIQVPQGATIIEVGKGLDEDGSKTTEKAIQLDLCQGSPGFTKPDSGFQYGRVEEVLRTGSVANDPDCQPRLKVPAVPGEFVVMAWPPSRLGLPGGMNW
jgi:hypothetical protein